LQKVSDGKRNPEGFNQACPGFFMEPTLKGERTMKKIISYRRRCLALNGTGLSHYILMPPKTDKK
jgi:modified peptide precursor CbpA